MNLIQSGSYSSCDIVRLLDCKLELAKVNASFDDFGRSMRAKEIFKECIDGYKLELGETNVKYLEAISELVRFIIKQNDGFEEAIELLKGLIQSQKEALGDYHVDLDSSYIIISSLYLKRDDMANSALYLKKVKDSKFQFFFLISYFL